MNTFEQFETGKLVLPETEQPFSTSPRPRTPLLKE